MKFRVIHTGDWYQQDKKEKLEKLGFKFDKVEEKRGRVVDMFYLEREVQTEPKDYDEEIKNKDVVEIELSSVEELMDFVKEYGEVVIKHPKQGLPIIEIYDDYRE